MGLRSAMPCSWISSSHSSDTPSGFAGMRMKIRASAGDALTGLSFIPISLWSLSKVLPFEA